MKKSYFCTKFLMRKPIGIGIFVLVALVATVACSKRKSASNSMIVGHWGCEQYVSCRTDSLDVQQWDTLHFEAIAGGEYELFFYDNGTGLLKLNNSPALIKEFSCNYEYDSVNQVITVESSSWLYALYGSVFLDENQGAFNVEELTTSHLTVSWTNRLSEPKPFFERFFIKRID